MDFFIHLRKDKGLSVSAIKGYRATLNSVLTLKGLDLSTSRELSMLFRTSQGLFLMGRSGLPFGTSLLSFRVLPVHLMSPFGRWMSVFLLTKRSSFWPFPLPSALGNFTPCHFMSLTLRVGVRHPFVSFRASWQKRRMPPLMTRGLRGSVYRPYLSRALILTLDSYVQCERSGVT